MLPSSNSQTGSDVTKSRNNWKAQAILRKPFNSKVSHKLYSKICQFQTNEKQPLSYRRYRQINSNEDQSDEMVAPNETLGAQLFNEQKVTSPISFEDQSNFVNSQATTPNMYERNLIRRLNSNEGGSIRSSNQQLVPTVRMKQSLKNARSSKNPLPA